LIVSILTKQKITDCILVFSLLFITSISEANFSTVRQFPSGVTFHNDTLYRSDGRGDNWCITWAADDSQITSMCDGNWLKGEQSYHNHLYRIVGGPDNFQKEDISKNGREMVLIWSDAMKDSSGKSHTVNYRWNHMKVTIQIR